MHPFTDKDGNVINNNNNTDSDSEENENVEITGVAQEYDKIQPDTQHNQDQAIKEVTEVEQDNVNNESGNTMDNETKKLQQSRN